eukprot:1160318-Pelagomonas_calceolata.AAC.2
MGLDDLDTIMFRVGQMHIILHIVRAPYTWNFQRWMSNGVCLLACSPVQRLQPKAHPSLAIPACLHVCGTMSACLRACGARGVQG